ncbi:chymotrypsinogen B-like [Daphnia pulicaria]|uniref:chymotrypsinogen B-like n=1 Tax=Daphnia pulicaria TaxID=35523 RepID=UPI001EEA5778|nr:chymotrypsinogen B-like [Daphnia pulicaria]
MGGVVVISGKNTLPATFRAALNPFLQQAKVSISGNDECRMDSSIGQYVIDTNICVSTPGKFTCTGDVGGPVVVLSSTGTWTLVGINSYTKDCASNGLKTRVSAFVPWINLYLN